MTVELEVELEGWVVDANVGTAALGCPVERSSTSFFITAGETHRVGAPKSSTRPPRSILHNRGKRFRIQ